MLGHTFVGRKDLRPPNKEVPPEVYMLLWILLLIHTHFETNLFFNFFYITCSILSIISLKKIFCRYPFDFDGYKPFVLFFFLKKFLFYCYFNFPLKIDNFCQGTNNTTQEIVFYVCKNCMEWVVTRL